MTTTDQHDPQTSGTEAALDAQESAGDGPTADPIERHPGSLGEGDPQSSADLFGKDPEPSPEEDAARALVLEWDDANLDERQVLLAAVTRAGGHAFVDSFSNGTVDFQTNALATLRAQLGLDDDE